jgi:transcriptional regulator with XRE-family HTH domain
METLGDRLINARERRGWDQTEAASRLGWPRSTLNQYEKNKRKPGPERLSYIAETYNVDVNYLVGRTDDPETPVLSSEETTILEQMRNNPDFGVAFSEFLATPEKKRKEFLRMWKVYKELAEQGEDDGMDEE